MPIQLWVNATIPSSTALASIQAAAFELNVRTITVFSICLSAPSRSLCFLGIGATTTSYFGADARFPVIKFTRFHVTVCNSISLDLDVKSPPVFAFSDR